MIKREQCSPNDQLLAIYRDLEIDIACAERQAKEGPFFAADPRQGREAITPYSLRAYAAKCRCDLKRLQDSEIPALQAIDRFITGKGKSSC